MGGTAPWGLSLPDVLYSLGVAQLGLTSRTDSVIFSPFLTSCPLRMFSQNAVAQLWYFVKCIYFALSAYQIRCGYPTRILGNFLTKKYNHLNLFLFQG